ncbi:MAG: ABC transporter permease [Chroococcidiopsidaceae cyanobacterium CP_BM_ER_R8_30]|nr:ABC transporter permease [Chroococcidiopsidaceae cyanobacterium CP_BM_ER_R8_30]
MIELFFAELRRGWIQFIRYPFEAVSVIVFTTTIFYGLFLSARYIAGPSLQFGNRLDSIVVGYTLWSLVLFIINEIALGLQFEAQTGTLEQVFLSPFGAPLVFVMRTLASLTRQLVLILGILLIIMTLTGSHLQFPPTLLFPLLAVLLGTYGMAFMIGALTLLLKRIQQLIVIFQFSLLFLMATPTEMWAGWRQLLRWLLPMTGGAGLLRDLMAWGEALDLSQLSFALLNGIGYFILGLLIFRFAEREAKRRGLLSGY